MALLVENPAWSYGRVGEVVGCSHSLVGLAAVSSDEVVSRGEQDAERGEVIKSLAGEHPDWSRARIAREVGCNESTVAKWLGPLSSSRRSVPVDRELVRELLGRDGMGYADIARQAGCSVSVVSLVATAAGIARRRSVDHEAILCLRSEHPDWSLAKVAEVAGVGESTVSHVLAGAGLSPGRNRVVFDESRVAELLGQGWDYQAVAEDVGVSVSVVRRFARTASGGGKRGTVLRVALVGVLEAHPDWSTVQVAEAAGCSTVTVQAARRAMALDEAAVAEVLGLHAERVPGSDIAGVVGLPAIVISWVVFLGGGTAVRSSSREWDIGRVLELYDQGMTVKKVAVAVGAAEETVRSVLLDNGRVLGRRRMSEERQATMGELLIAVPVLTHQEIADVVGCKVHTVRSYASRMGISRLGRTDHSAIRAVITAHPDWSLRRVGRECGVSSRTVARVKEIMAGDAGEVD